MLRHEDKIDAYSNASPLPSSALLAEGPQNTGSNKAFSRVCAKSHRVRKGIQERVFKVKHLGGNSADIISLLRSSEVCQGEIVSWRQNLFMLWRKKVKVAQSCPTLCNPMDYTVHGILQARILEWVAYRFFKGSSQPRDQTGVTCIAGEFFTS